MERFQSQYRTVVQGEASESEDEDEITTSSDTPSQPPPQGVVVQGEASESDEEELDSSGNPIPKALPAIRLNENSASYESLDSLGNVPTLSPRHVQRPKYDTVLNRRLWESNLSFCSSLNGMGAQTYLGAAKDISNCAQQLSKSHAAIQDVSHNMRLLTNDLFNLDDRIDIVSSCTLLPDIKLPSRTQAPQQQTEVQAS